MHVNKMSKEERKLLERIGREIRGRRKDQLLTQEKLASKSGVARSYISSIETRAVMPSIFILSRIAKGLGTNVGELLGE